VALDPWFAMYPAAAALTYFGLAGGVYRRRAALGGAVGEWMAAFLLCGGGFVGFLAAGAASWNSGSDIAAAAGGAGAALGLLGAYSGLLQRYSGGRIGSPTFRLTMFGAGLALVSLGIGAALGAAGQRGDGEPAGWVLIPVTAAAVAILPIAVLASRKGLARAGPVNTLQLLAGGAVVAAGLIASALGDIFVGPFLGMAGGAFLYSGVSAVVGKAPAARAPAVTPKVVSEEAAERPPPRGAPGRKVRVPKGAAMRVSAFRDDEPGDLK
jgi:hypothetical protein